MEITAETVHLVSFAGKPNSPELRKTTGETTAVLSTCSGDRSHSLGFPNLYSCVISRKRNATNVSILVFPPFYFYHFWGVTCLPINLHMNTLLNT
ncbi:hypothetical protein HanRHA438_Chr16g0756431 [Helianthus annuus]|nr:hypothetical protein HanRHA438_Chr16g0756431 [Helianthus annuus]